MTGDERIRILRRGLERDARRSYQGEQRIALQHRLRWTGEIRRAPVIPDRVDVTSGAQRLVAPRYYGIAERRTHGDGDADRYRDRRRQTRERCHAMAP